MAAKRILGSSHFFHCANFHPARLCTATAATATAAAQFQVFLHTLCCSVYTESSQIIEQVTDPTLPGTGSTLRALCELRIAQITRSIKEPGAWGEWRGPETAAGDKE